MARDTKPNRGTVTTTALVGLVAEPIRVMLPSGPWVPAPRKAIWSPLPRIRRGQMKSEMAPVVGTRNWLR